MGCLRVSAFLWIAVGLLSAGCAGQNGYAPVDDRGREYSSKGSRGQVGNHRVASGDTLYSIAFQYSLRYQEIASWNGIGPPYLIRVEQVLRLAPPEKKAVAR